MNSLGNKVGKVSEHHVMALKGHVGRKSLKFTNPLGRCQSHQKEGFLRQEPARGRSHRLEWGSHEMAQDHIHVPGGHFESGTGKLLTTGPDYVPQDWVSGEIKAFETKHTVKHGLVTLYRREGKVTVLV